MPRPLSLRPLGSPSNMSGVHYEGLSPGDCVDLPSTRLLALGTLDSQQWEVRFA